MKTAGSIFLALIAVFGMNSCKKKTESPAQQDETLASSYNKMGYDYYGTIDLYPQGTTIDYYTNVLDMRFIDGKLIVLDEGVRFPSVSFQRYTSYYKHTLDGGAFKEVQLNNCNDKNTDGAYYYKLFGNGKYINSYVNRVPGGGYGYLSDFCSDNALRSSSSLRTMDFCRVFYQGYDIKAISKGFISGLSSYGLFAFDYKFNLNWSEPDTLIGVGHIQEMDVVSTDDGNAYIAYTYLDNDASGGSNDGLLGIFGNNGSAWVKFNTVNVKDIAEQPYVSRNPAEVRMIENGENPFILIIRNDFKDAGKQYMSVFKLNGYDLIPVADGVNTGAELSRFPSLLIEDPNGGLCYNTFKNKFFVHENELYAINMESGTIGQQTIYKLTGNQFVKWKTLNLQNSKNVPIAINAAFSLNGKIYVCCSNARPSHAGGLNDQISIDIISLRQ